MLGNALDNACKWATHQVTLSAQSQARNVIITVDDDGPGLPPTSARPCASVACARMSRFPVRGSGWPLWMTWRACMVAK